MPLERKPREYRYAFGPYSAVIYGKGRSYRGVRLLPALQISQSFGRGVMDYGDVHFSQAKEVRTLRKRLARFAARRGFGLGI